MNHHAGNVIEVINRNVVVTLLLQSGYNVFLPVYDDGIDFILHRRDDDAVVKAQLKSRLTIASKDLGRGITMIFPHRGEWFLVPHDVLVDLAPSAWKGTPSWLRGGGYSTGRPSAQTLARLAPYRLADISGVAAEAAKAIADDDVETSDVWEELRALRARHDGPPFTAGEILSLRDEGRR